MNRASPADMRKALAMVEALKSAGILFVPMPVDGEEETATRVAEAQSRLDQMVESET